MGKITIKSPVEPKVIPGKSAKELFGVIASRVYLKLMFHTETADYSTIETAIFYAFDYFHVVARCVVPFDNQMHSRMLIEFNSRYQEEYLDRFTKAVEEAVKDLEVDVEIKVV